MAACSRGHREVEANVLCHSPWPFPARGLLFVKWVLLAFKKSLDFIFEKCYFSLLVFRNKCVSDCAPGLLIRWKYVNGPVISNQVLAP